MVGLRVFDIGALIVWLIWFFRLRDDDDDAGGGVAEVQSSSWCDERQANSFESPCAKAGAQVGTVIAMMLPFSTGSERRSANVAVVPK